MTAADAELQPALEAIPKPRVRDGIFIAAAVAVGLAVAAFVLIAGRTQLWYDEANYLVIAQNIKRIGLPVFYWLPGQPTLFWDSPPGLFYALSLLPAAILNTPSLVRAVYAVGAFALIFGPLWYHLRGTIGAWRTIATTAILAVTTGYLLIESIQVRMDLPLAALSFAVLSLVAQVDSSEARARARDMLLSCLAILALSSLAYLTKYQAVCLSGALGLWGLTRLLHLRKIIPVGLAHVLGMIVAIAVLMAISWKFGGSSDTSIPDNFRHNLGRIFSGSQASGDYQRLWPTLNAVSIKLAIPAVALAAAMLAGRIRLAQEPLLALCIYLSLMVTAFNLIMFRMPGGGDYYMTQAAVPLAYITARSIGVLVPSGRALMLAVVAAAINLGMSMPLGSDPPQRWSAGLWAIGSGLTQSDQARAVADVLKQQLRPGQAVLMDDWQYQAHTLSYWLDTDAPSGYLLETQPTEAVRLLGLTGKDQVGAIAFAGSTAIQTLQSDQWKEVWKLIAANFVETPIAGSPDWHVYLRRG